MREGTKDGDLHKDSIMSGEDTSRATLFSLRTRGGVVKCSVAWQIKNLKALDDVPGCSGVVDEAKHIVTKLEGLDKDFCSVHCEIDNLFELGSDELEREHEALDWHEDEIADAFLRLQCLIDHNRTTTGVSNSEKVSSRKLSMVECLL